MIESTKDQISFVPLMTREQFSGLTGIPLGVLNNQIDRGYWPTVRIGKWSLVNVALVHQHALEKAFEKLSA